jgi:predicted ATPase/tetratricopeptide (TPR) repeat protein
MTEVLRKLDTTSFVGRREDLRHLSQLLDQHRLVTITGAVGVGKSRLAREAALDWCSRRSGSAWLCDLSRVRERDELVRVLCRTLAIEHAPATGHDLARILEHRGTALLVCDGCEELSADAIELLHECVQGERDLRLLLTSAIRTHLVDEIRFELRALPEARELLASRVRTATGSAVETLVTPKQLTALLRRLDGIPLAIELTASLMGVLSVEALLARTDVLLDLSLPDEEQTRGQRSLRQALSVAWERLSPDAQSALASFSVFRGGFDLAAAGVVLERDDAHVLPQLRMLQDRSLIRVEPAFDRYVLFGSVQAFAAAELEASRRNAEVVRRHAAHFSTLALHAVTESEGSALLEWAQRMRREEDNLRAVIAEGVADPRLAREAVTAAGGLLWLLIGRAPLAEVTRLCREVDERCVPHVSDPRACGYFMLGAASASSFVGELTAGLRYSAAGLAHAKAAKDERLIQRLLVRHARIHRLLGDGGEERRALREAESLAERTSDHVGRLLVAFARLAAEDFPAPERRSSFYAELIAGAERTGDPTLTLRALSEATQWFGAAGAHAEALSALGRADAVAAKPGIHGSWRTLFSRLRGMVLHTMGDLEGSRREYDAALACVRETGFTHGEGECLLYLGIALLEGGDVEAALLHLGDAARLLSPSSAERVMALAATAVGYARHGQFDRARSKLRELPSVPEKSDTAVILAAFGSLIDLEASSRKNADDYQRTRAAVVATLEPHAVRSLSATLARSVLQRTLTNFAFHGQPLAIGPSASWFRIGAGEPCSLEGRPVLRALLWRLARERLAHPGRAVLRTDLVAAIWPESQRQRSITNNRLNVALSSLRKLGLKTQLLAEVGAVRLDERVPIELVEE